ncbi:MIP/aquaporin family protein [Lactococcus cremoris]|uniref:MIP/aquaporin family protein n=1 Tax=Lactococcus lactis subsp. cremoris TaxID=1359 RepID=A0AAJ6MGZ2_LACLC|nr:MIP/aquaporin family protein [Lactococcus cremoris]WOW92994.1 MIP/aquaporin family protein [Lactococcus cremoris]
MTLQILGEFLGTFILVLLGNGVVAANVLGKTKSENAGWVTIAIGWGLAVAVAVWLHYYPHWEETKDSSLILASFATAPAIRHSWSNFLGEAFDGGLLMLLIMAMGHYRLEGGFGTIIIGFLIMAVGFSLGPTTGYAMNPARDLGPRIMHALLPIKNKGTSDWGYAWIPATGSIVGAVIAGLLYQWMLTLH